MSNNQQSNFQLESHNSTAMPYNAEQQQYQQQQNYQGMNEGQHGSQNPLQLSNNMNSNIMGLNNAQNSMQSNLINQPKSEMMMGFKQQSEYFPNNLHQMQPSDFMSQNGQMQPNLELTNMQSNNINQHQQSLPQQQQQQGQYPPQYVGQPIFVNTQQQQPQQWNGGMGGQGVQAGGMTLLSNKENGGANYPQDKNFQNYSAAQKDEIHKRRRARNDPNNRDYQCPCGKSYLSYPALYTHIKQKHEGKAPGQVKRPNNQNSKRGRPIGKTTMLKDKDEEDFENQSTASNEALEVIEQLQLFIHEELGTSALIIDNKSHSKEELMDIFPREKFFGEEKDYYEDIYEYFSDILEKEGEIEENLNEEALYSTCCNQIFANFLYKTSKHLQKDIIRELAFYVCMFRASVNNLNRDMNKTEQQSLDGGQPEEEEKDSNNKSNNNIDKLYNYCSQNGGENLLEYSNDFIMKELPTQLEKFKDKIENFQLIKEEFRLSRVIKITKFFCNWLFYKKYTECQLQINENDDEEGNLDEKDENQEDEEQ